MYISMHHTHTHRHEGRGKDEKRGREREREMLERGSKVKYKLHAFLNPLI